MHLDKLTDKVIMALTVWGEARGEFARGQEAVAWVIRNRMDNPRWWGRSLRDVCLKPRQFSCWNFEDPNYQKLMSVELRSTLLYKSIETICEQVLYLDRSEDITLNSDHYCVSSIVHRVVWARNRKPTAVIGHHNFYRLELNAP